MGVRLLMPEAWQARSRNVSIGMRTPAESRVSTHGWAIGVEVEALPASLLPHSWLRWRCVGCRGARVGKRAPHAPRNKHNKNVSHHPLCLCFRRLSSVSPTPTHLLVGQQWDDNE